ncbi:MAG: ORF6N domain-containing protein [Terracidiphilus sp.]
MTSQSVLVPKPIENQIYLVRGQKVLLDFDLAALYGVQVRALNQAVKRNERRFPSDFVFRLTAEENQTLKSQTVISGSSHGGRRYLPYAFTEHGAIMAASVLNSPRAVEMSIFVVRAFLRLREAIAANKALAAKLAELEQRLETHDKKIDEIIRAIRVLSAPPEKPVRRIGFLADTVSKPKMLRASKGRSENRKTPK